MIGSIVFAAVVLCANADAVRAADGLFSKAESAFLQQQQAPAREYYNTGMQTLAGTPWYIQDKQCDPPGYTLERYVATLHSLDIAASSDILQPFEAYQHFRQMQKDVWKPFPIAIDQYFQQKYPDLHRREWSYIDAIVSKSRPQVTLAHTPSDNNCKWRDVDADVSTSVTPDYPDPAREDSLRAVEVIVKVSLSADGRVMSTAVMQSSGNLYLDAASVNAARASTYLPAVRDCKQVPGSFDFHVTFDPNG